MKNRLFICLLFICVMALFSCNKFDEFIGSNNENDNNENERQRLTFIDEFILADTTTFEGTVVGGLSGIDYTNGIWYIISDDPNTPRFYSAAINYTLDGFSQVNLSSVSELKDIAGASFASGTVDPEALRIFGGNVVWTSEGNVNNGVNPFIRRATLAGDFINETILRDRYKVSTDNSFGPRQNGVFEGVSLSVDGTGFWVNIELPLVQDGFAPTTEDTDSPIRVAYIDRVTGEFGKEFAYELDPVVRPAANGSSFEINGVVEILEYDINKFFFVERSFSTGYDDGGNNVKIYDVDASKATDISEIDDLSGANFTVATKTLLFDFEDIRSELTDGIVDNIEGITFGPDFANGNKSLVLVSDNNFSAFGPQLNQFVLFELEN